MTKLSAILGGKYTHDVFTKKLLLNDEIETDKDDTLLAKPYSKTNEVIYWHYDHTIHRNAKGIMMLNFHYTDASGISLPVGYEIVTKTEDVYDKKKKKIVKKSKFRKNEIMRDKLEILNFHNELKYRLKIIKQVSKDGNDDESIYLYLVTNDIDLSTNKILEIYKRRWKIEEYQGLPLEGISHLNKILKLNILLLK